MEKSVPTENPEPEESGAADYATRKIDADELLAALEQESPPAPEAATEILTQAEETAATVSHPEFLEPASPTPIAVEPPAPSAATAHPEAPVPPAAPKKEDHTTMLVIFAVAAVALVCICACTIIAVTALLMIPNL